MSMNRTCRSILMVTLVTMLFGALILAPFQSDGAETEYDREITCYYYAVGMSWAGQEAETVTWDFGDGSTTETGFNVTHRYAEIGDYVVTLTATNNLGTDVKHYLVHIMGYPVVSFDSNGGSSVASIQMQSGGNGAVAATEPTDPTRAGYTFAGWFTDQALTQPYDWSKLVTVSMTLYAKWLDSSVPTVTVTFDSNGGSEVPSQTISQGGYVGEPATPVLDGYVFDGWYFTDGDREVRFTFKEQVNTDLVLKAHWTEFIPEEPSDVPEDDPDNGSGLSSILPIIVIVLGAILALAALLTGIFLIGIPAAICIVLGILLFTKVIAL